jgi:DNA invertase Pin-like site-specific DNA recombinase
VVAEYADEGISGAKGRDGRPQLDLLLKDAVRRRFDVAMFWAVDRLGRSLPDLIGSMQELHGAKVDLFMLQQGIDTATPGGKAMFQMLGVFGEFERAIIQARVKSGMARAMNRRLARFASARTASAANTSAGRRFRRTLRRQSARGWPLVPAS